MYFLLEDNRIIKLDNAKFSECGLLKVYEETGKVTTLKLDGTIERYTGYFVKKQSENVVDLIENEDLIKIRFGDSFNILEACHIGGGVNGMTNITAIYKPDANGNYIKVWEEKDE